MKKFEFKLETVLKMRIRHEEQCQKDLRDAEKLRSEAARQVEIRNDQIEETVKFYQQSMLKFDLFTVTNYQDYLQWLTRMLESELEQLEECDRRVAFARNRLIEASKEKKIVEKLKERAYQQYQAEALRTDIQFLDELGTNRFVRQDTDG
jgi:flagellar FliJ protein